MHSCRRATGLLRTKRFEFANLSRVRARSVFRSCIVSTNLGHNFAKEQLLAFGVIDASGNPIIDPQRQLKTVGRGAAPQVWCANILKLEGMGGVYREKARWLGLSHRNSHR